MHAGLVFVSMNDNCGSGVFRSHLAPSPVDRNSVVGPVDSADDMHPVGSSGEEEGSEGPCAYVKHSIYRMKCGVYDVAFYTSRYLCWHHLLNRASGLVMMGRMHTLDCSAFSHVIR